MQHSAAENTPYILIRVLLNAQSQVAVKFCCQTVADVARCDEFAVAAEKRTIVYGESHRHCRFVDGYAGEGFRCFSIGYGITDFESFESDDGTDVTAAYFLHTFASHSFEGMQFFDTLAAYGAVATA